ncbi:TPA: hypothetical protein N2R70_000943 [Citrobacter freundii]|nr:hypothetical protein [Citrobacter freundii]
MKQIAQENIIELAKLGHERAAELKASCGAVDVRSFAQLISDLASHLEVQYVRAENAQREFRSADITMQNLEANCAALAAENAALKKAAEFSTAEDMWIEQADGMLDYRYVDWYVDVLKAAMETPSTDDFLAEVRASARDNFIDRIEWIIRNECNPDKTEAIISELQKFSDELKLEAAQ